MSERIFLGSIQRELEALAAAVEALEVERDAWCERALRAERREGELLDQIHELRAGSSTEG